MSASLQSIRRRHAARAVRVVRIRAEVWIAASFNEPDDDDWDGEDLDARRADGFCPSCGGSGRDDWSDGIMPCEHCDGEGYAWWR